MQLISSNAGAIATQIFSNKELSAIISKHGKEGVVLILGTVAIAAIHDLGVKAIEHGQKFKASLTPKGLQMSVGYSEEE